jgi:hypothetical protein
MSGPWSNTSQADKTEPMTLKATTRFLFGFTLLAFIVAVSANEVVSLNSFSRTRNAIEINQGSFDGIKVGDTAKFTFTHDGKMPTSTSGHAWGEAIEVNSRSSFWLLTNLSPRWTQDPAPTQKLIFRKDIVSARKFFTIKPPAPPPLEDEPLSREQSLQDYQKRLQNKEENTAEMLSKVTDISKLQPADWNRKRYKYYIDKTGKRVRHPYKDDRSDIIQRSISKKLIGDSLFYPNRRAQVFDENKQSQREIKRRFMDDGLTIERTRQLHQIHHKKNQEFLLFYSQSMLYHTSLDDPTFNISGYSMAIGYELLLARIKKKWSKLTLRTNYQNGTNYYNVNGYNAQADQWSLQFFLNWYPWNGPTSILKPMLYVGAGLGLGGADVKPSSGATEKEPVWSYRLYQIPALNAGVKYRFRAGDTMGIIVPLGLAIHLGVSYQFMALLPTTELPGNIDGTITAHDFKLISGLSFYF